MRLSHSGPRNTCSLRDQGARGQPSFETNLCDSAVYRSVRRQPGHIGNASIPSEANCGPPVRKSAIPGLAGVNLAVRATLYRILSSNAVNTGRKGSLGREGGTRRALSRSQQSRPARSENSLTPGTSPSPESFAESTTVLGKVGKAPGKAGKVPLVHCFVAAPRS